MKLSDLTIPLIIRLYLPMNFGTLYRKMKKYIQNHQKSFSLHRINKHLYIGVIMKNNCQNLYLLSTIACQLAECLDEKELEMLSANLTTLGYMIEFLLAHQSVCKDD